MRRDLKPHVLYRVSLGDYSFGPISKTRLREIFSNGRLVYPLIEGVIAYHCPNVIMAGDGAGKDLLEYNSEYGITSIQNKSFHSEGKESKKPDKPMIHSTSSASFEDRKNLTLEDALDYCHKFDWFLYHDLDAIRRDAVEFVVIPSNLVSKAVESSFYSGTASDKGKVSLNFIRSNIHEVETIADSSKEEENIG